MIQELLYTSHEGRGLRQGGGGGFCTVLSTEGMASNLAAALEKLSGYKHPFDIHDPRSRQNPINWRHAIIRVGGVAYHVLSRIADLKGEHTGRSNKLAHHVVLGPGDEVPGGPTRLLMHPGFSRTSWNGKVELVQAAPKSSLPSDDLPPRVCSHWRDAAGDAGMAGFVAEQLLSRPNPVVSVIFPLGADALSLVDEVFSLLTPERRWATTFSTYYAAAPPISSCHLRFILDGTPDAELLRRDYRQVFVDLANPPKQLEATPLASAARSGVRADRQPAAPRTRSAAVESAPAPADSNESVPDVPTLAPLVVADETFSSPAMERSFKRSNRLPSSTPGQYRAKYGSSRSRSMRKWLIGACAVTTVLCVCVLAYALITTTIRTRQSAEASAASRPQKQATTVESSPGNRAVSSFPQPHQIDTGAARNTSGQQQASDVPTTQLEVNASAGTPSNENDAVPATIDESASQASQAQDPGAQPQDDAQIILLSGPQPPPLDHIQGLEYVAPTAEIIGEDSIAGTIEDCALLGLDWISKKWFVAKTDSFDWKRVSPDQLAWRIAIPQTSTTSMQPLAVFTIRDGKPIFEWVPAAARQVKGDRKKAAILNAVRWCLLRVTANGKRHYFRLSDLRGPVECNLFPSERQEELLDTVLPVFIKPFDFEHVKLQLGISTRSSVPIEAVGHFDGGVRLKYIPPGFTDDWVNIESKIMVTIDGTCEIVSSHTFNCMFLVGNAFTRKKAKQENSPRIKEVRNTFLTKEAFDKEFRALEDLLTGLETSLSEKNWENDEPGKVALERDRTEVERRRDELKDFVKHYEELEGNGLFVPVTLHASYTDDGKIVNLPILSDDFQTHSGTTAKR